MIRTLAVKVIEGLHSQSWEVIGRGGAWAGAMRPLEIYIRSKVKRAVKAERQACAEMQRRAAAYDGLVAQRDALLEALKKAKENGCATVYSNEDDECGVKGCCGVVSYKPHADDCWVTMARAAIKAVEGDKDAHWQAVAQEAQKLFDERLKKFEGEKD